MPHTGDQIAANGFFPARQEQGVNAPTIALIAPLELGAPYARNIAGSGFDVHEYIYKGGRDYLGRLARQLAEGSWDAVVGYFVGEEWEGALPELDGRQALVVLHMERQPAYVPQHTEKTLFVQAPMLGRELAPILREHIQRVAELE